MEPAALETLVHVLAERARQQPQQTAFAFLTDPDHKEERLSYAETLLQARKVAAFLQSVAHPGDRIVLLYQPGLEYVTAFLGCLYAGMIAVPLYPPRNRRLFRVEEVFRNARPRAAITSTGLYAGIAAFMTSGSDYADVALYSTSDLLDELANEAGPPVTRAGDLAFLQYTSGSTGAPKGVMVSHGNLMANCQALARAWTCRPKEVFASWLPLYHDMGLIGNMLLPLYLGAPTVLMSPAAFIQNPVRWLEVITRYRATVAGAPNFAYDLCAEKVTPTQIANLDLRSWRIAFNGSEPIRAATLARFAETFAPAGLRPEQLYPCYGMAEVTLIASGGDAAMPPIVRSMDLAAEGPNAELPPEATPNARQTFELVGCGQAVAGHRVCIVDPVDLSTLPDGKVGEIWIAGPSVTEGYWNNEEATRANFGAHTADGDGPFLRSGDLGLLDRGELFVTGRIKDLIIVRGRNHYPQDLEVVASRCHPALRNNAAAAFGVEIEGLEQAVLVQEVERGSEQTDWDHVFPLIREAVVDAYELELHAIVLIRTNTLSKTSSGKIQRHAARAQFLAGELEVVVRWTAGANPEHRTVKPIEGRPERPVAGPEVAPAPAATQLAAASLESTAQHPRAATELRGDAQAYERLRELIQRRVAAALHLPPDAVDMDRPLAQYGMSSQVAIGLSGDLGRELGRWLSPTLLYDHPTITRLARQLCGQETAPSVPRIPALAARPDSHHEPVAVIGLGCRFPGAAGPTAFWDLLCRGGDAIRAMPPERRALLDLAEHSEPLWGGYLDGVELFDPAAFGISPHEADFMDPQQRLVLEVASEALGAAAIAPSCLAGSRTGVFVGISTRDYERLQVGTPEIVYMAPGNAASIAANRLSYVLDLRGPSVAVDSACSSSLVAVHEACVALGTGACDVALAGGVNVLLDPGVTRMLTHGGLMAADGQCKTFDERADGYVRSEGCGMVVLKRLADAERAGDPILAVIRGSAVNHDGRSNGLMAPNGPAQEAVIREALDRAGVAPAELNYVEAHGTGTALGDPIELGALQRVLGPGRGPGARCAVGSVKANVGHMEAAAGIGGLIKTVLALRHGQLPPHIRLRRLNPRISLEPGFYIPVELTAWNTGQAPRVAGVSSFGFGGTNAHVIVTQAAVQGRGDRATPAAPGPGVHAVHVLPLSAPSEESLVQLAAACVDYLDARPGAALAEVCHTLAVGRDHQPHRLAVVARTVRELRDGLVAQRRKLGASRSRPASGRPPRIGFLFAGQGSLAPHAGRELYQAHPVFRDAMDRCDVLARPGLGCSLLSVLYPERDDDHRLQDTRFGQVAMFALEYALSELWRSWGITPAAVIGHSLGEYAAACAAGMLDLEAGVRLVVERGRLMQEVSAGGGMLTVHATAVQTEPLLRDLPGLAIAAYNTPANLAVSGPTDLLDRLQARLEVAGIRHRRLHVTVANHSAMMEPILDAFEQAAAAVAFRAPHIRFYSTATGAELVQAPGADYWRQQLRGAVRFHDALTRLHADGGELLLEIGPRQVLTRLAAETLGTAGSCIPSLQANIPELDSLADAVARLYVAGAPLRWEHLESHAPRLPDLPLAGLSRTRCWFTRPPAQAGKLAVSALSASAPDPAEPATARVPPPPERHAEILTQLQAMLAALLRTEPAAIDPARPLLELGVDSLMLMTVLVDINNHFGVEIGTRELFEELPTLADVARYLDVHMAVPAARPEPVVVVVPTFAPGPAPWPEVPASRPGMPPAVAATHEIAAVVARMMDQHTQLMTMALRLLGGQPPDGPPTAPPGPPTAPPHGPPPAGPAPRRGTASAAGAAPAPVGLQDPAGHSRTAALAEVAITPVARERTMPMSFAQERMWFLHLLQPDSPAYNMSAAVQLTGKLDRAVLASCVHEVVRRHEILRTTFAVAEDGAGVQRIASPQAAVLPPLPEVDLSHMPATERTAALEQLSRDEAQAPFDLRQGPLLRTRLVRLGSDEHVWLFQLHHIVSDGWSLIVFLREIGALYEASIAGRGSPLRPLSVQYADHAQRQRLQGERFERELGYWTGALAGIPDVLALPTDRPRPALQRYHGDRVAVSLPRALTEGLKALGHRHGATLFMTVLAGFQVLLARYSRQPDVVVGTPIAGRSRPELRELIGLFVNTLPLRARVRGTARFVELLGQVRGTVREAFAHQEVPFERIVDALGVPRDLGRTPVVQVLFVLQNMPIMDRPISGLAMREYEIANQTAKLDLTLTLWEADGALSGSLEYNTDLFDRATVARMARHLQTVLAAAVAAPDTPVHALALGDAAERAELAAWNATTEDLGGSGCLHERIAAQAVRTPSQVAVVFEAQQLTYGELLARAHQLAHHLRRLGVGPDVIVAVLLERSVDLVVALLGILAAGGAYLPLDPDDPAERLAFAVRDTGAPVLVTCEALAGRPAAHAARVICVDRDRAAFAAEPAIAPDSGVTAAHLAYVIYTSGSTGIPKGVGNAHAGIVNRLLWHQRRFPLGPGDKVLHKTPYTFDVSVWDLFWPLVAGATLVVARPGGHRDPQYLAEIIAAEGITCVHFVPSMLRAFVEALDDHGAGRRWPRLAWVMSSGEALSRELVALCVGRLGEGTELHNLYGPTEAAVDVTHWHCRPEDVSDVVPIGVPVANTQIHVVDDALWPVPVGVPGELCIGGTHVARGYVGRPGLTAERFVPDPFSRVPGARMYRTGDLARHRHGGVLEFLGRIDFQVKLHGVRIELGEIEAALCGLTGVHNAVALIREDRPGDQRLVTYVVPRPGAAITPGTLRQALKARLPAHMIPSTPGDMVVLASLPLTASGKLDRKALPAPPQDTEDARADRAAAPTATRGAIEAAVASIWAAVLGRPAIGSLDHFFECGGHSLLATQVIVRLRRELHVEIPLHALFEAPTLAGFAEWVDGALGARQPGANEPAIERLTRPPGEVVELPASFAQERLWFLHQLEPDSPAYHMAAAVHMAGTLDVSALEAGLRAIVRRHEVLRTTFATAADGQSMQRIAPAAPDDDAGVAPLLERVDLSHLAGAAQEAELARQAHEYARAVFDLARGPLVRTRLVRLGAREHVWLVTLHHIIADDWSIGVLLRELSELYAARLEGRAVRLAALPVQYADYARWQRDVLRGKVGARELGYWTSALAGIPEALALPTDRPRPLVQSYRGGVVPVHVPAAVTRALEALGQRMGATLYMVLLAGFQVLLGRYSRQTDVVVGSPVANRMRGELEGLIGCFVNTLALRARLDGDPRFTELLAQVRGTALEAYAHQLVPFERIVEALGVARDLGRTPVFQVLFTLQNAPLAPLALAGLVLREHELATDTAKLDLDLTLRQAGGALEGTLEYNADLLDAATVERLVGHLGTLLAGIATAPESRLSALPWLTEAEREVLITERNQTAFDFAAVRPAWAGKPRFFELFEAQVARTPEAVAVECEGHRLTYTALADRAGRIAGELRAAGIGREQVVAVLADRDPDFVAAILGIFQAGAAYMPLDPEWPAARMQTVLAQSRASLLVASAPYLAIAAELGALPVHALAVLLAAPLPEVPVRVQGSADDLAYVLFTSGSTGTPKGVMVPHAAMINQQLAKLVELELCAGDTIAQTARQSFDISVWQLLALLVVGGRVVILRGERAWVPGLILAELAAHRVTIAELVPSHLALLLEELEARPGVHDLSRLRWVMPTGEALAPALCRRWFGLYPAVPLVNAYGPAECADDTSLCKVYEAPRTTFVPIHGTVANLRYYVVDTALRLVPDGVPGELCIGGAGPGRGYIGEPGRTALAFVPDPFAREPGARMYRTGDLVRYRADGSLEFLHRIDHQVKLRGFRIELGEIEAALLSCPEVREAVALMRGDPPDEPHLVAYVVPRSADDARATINTATLRQVLEARLPVYMVPSALVVLADLPRTPGGKLDRAALPAPAAHEPAVAPTTPSEVLLAGIWSQLLGTNAVARDDNFFALGGHSLLATQLASRIRAATGLELALRSIFEHQSLAVLAAHLDRLSATRATHAGAPPLVAMTRPADHVAELPMSFAQERLWFLHWLDPDSPAYNMAGAFGLSGALDHAAFEHALGDLAARHEGLRTTFVTAGSGPGVQRIAPPASVSWTAPIVDLTGLTVSEQQAELERQARDHARLPFDLGRGPLVRSRLLRVGPDEHVWLVTMHHIISDDWSIGVLVRELSELYAARLEGRTAQLAALPVQYADYAQWQRQVLQGEVLDHELRYWTDALAGIPEALELPTDRPRPPVQRHRGGVVPVCVPESLTRALQELARREGATLFMVLLAGFQLLLSRYSRQTDVVVGSPVANRTRGELEGLIGFFVNTLALRARVDGTSRFTELLAQVRDTALDAYAHQLVPFERIVEALGVVRDLGRTPVFQVLFTLQNAPMAPLHLPGLVLREHELATDTARFDLELTLREVDGALVGTLEYDADLFDEVTARCMARHYGNLMAAVAASPEAPVHELELGDEAERARMTAWNTTATELDGSGCVHELIAAQAARTPGHVAVIFDEQRLTYAELLEPAHQLAHHLRALGVGPDVIVAVLLERSLDLVVALLGILQAGGAYLPLDPEHPAERLAFAVRDARAPVLLTCKALANRPAEHAARVVYLDADEAVIAAAPASAPVSGCTADHLAYVLYTSGSTGTPKGVTISHRSIVNRLLSLRSRFALGAGDRILHKAAYTFDVSVWELFAPLVAGATVIIARPEGHRDPRYLAELIAREHVTYVDMVPVMLRAFLDVLADDAELRRGCGLRRVFCGGEVLPRELAARFAATVGPEVELYNLYGPTETAVDATCWLCRPDDSSSAVPIGTPVPNTRIYLLDEALRRVPVGVPGELCIGGVQVARGYLGRPALTAERFVPDPFSGAGGARLYRTGDLARYRPAGDGAIEFLGRVDFQIKLRGLRIEPGEIEAAILACAGVREAVVLVRQDPPGEPRLVAYVVHQPDAEIDTAALREAVTARLPAYMAPSDFVVLADLPRTTSGKLDRRALPAPETTLHEAPARGVEPRTPAEQILAGIWREVLGTRWVGRLDDFFARGGHSLLAIQVASRASHAFGVHVPVRAIFERPVLAALAAYVQQADSRWHLPPLRPVPRTHRLPLSFPQEQLWIAQMLLPASGAYNMSAGLRIRGPLDLDVLGRTLTELVSRHEILRMRVELHDGQPCLAIAAELPLGMVEHDLRPVAAADARAAELARRLEEHATTPFDLGQAPLFRLACFRMADDEVVLVLTLHHVTCDGWSFNLLAGELAALYEAFAAGLPSPLPAPAIQYADVAAWQRAWMTGAVLDEHIEHFARKLGGELPVLTLPLDRPRSQRTGSAGASLVQPLDPDLRRALEQLCQALGATINMTLMAGFLVLLHRFSRQEDLILGTAVAGRMCPEMEPLIGCFINILVLRFDLTAKPSFRELVAQVRRETLEAYDYQSLPFEKLLDALNPRREPGVSPVFQVAFGVRNAVQPPLALAGLELEWLPPVSESARYDLTVWIEEAADQLRVEWTYRTELFDAATIREMAASYEDVLRRAVSDPDIGLLALAIGPHGGRDSASHTARQLALGETLRRVKRRSRAVDEAG